MVIQLLESQHERQRRAAGATLSLMVHALLIALAVELTMEAAKQVERIMPERLVFAEVRQAEAPPAPPPEEVVKAPAPDQVVVQPSALPAKGFQVLVAPVTIPNTLPNIDFSKSMTNEADFSGRGVAGGIAKGVVGGVPTNKPTAVVEEATHAYLVTEVEKAAAPLPDVVPPRYPEMLRVAGIEGTVVAQWVVDTAGRADMATFRVLRSEHDQFSEAVRLTVSRMRFYPAEIGGRRVRMLVEQPFEFRLEKG
jgi:protein TonB